MFKSFEVNLLSDFILLLTNKYCARLIMCLRVILRNVTIVQ